MATDLTPVERLSRDLAEAARTLSDDEARYLVDAYYLMQDDRKRSHNQIRALDESAEPNMVLRWFAKQNETLEQQIQRALDKYTDAHPMGAFMRDVVGIGPVLSAGLLAHIDITKCPTVGHLWRFAGLDPTVIWPSPEKASAWLKEHDGPDLIERAAKHFGRGREWIARMNAGGGKSLAVELARRPWNTPLKTLTWKIGQSFMKFSGRDDCYYGKVYRQRKEYEVARNERGDNAGIAAQALAQKRFGKTTEAYKWLSEGKLPPAQIDGRARRYAVKLFLAHMWEAWYRLRFDREPPAPYPIAHMGHTHKISYPGK